MKLRWFIGLYSLAVSVVAAENAAPQARTLSLQDCVVLALQKNLELRIERYNPQLALYNLNAAYAGYEPVFNASGQHDKGKSGSSVFQGGLLIPGSENDANSFNTGLSGFTPWGMNYNLHGTASERYGNSFGLGTNGTINANPFDSTSGSVQMDLVQPVLKNLWIDSTRLNIAVSKNRVKYTELGLKGRIIDVVTRVELAYYDLKYALENVQVQQSALELAQRLLDENRKRVEVGAMAPLDMQQAEAEAAARQADLTTAHRNVEVAQNALKRLVTDDYAAWNPVSVQPADPLDAELQIFNLQDSWTKGLTQRPDYLQAKLDLEKQGVQLKYDRNQLYPQLDLFGSYGYNGSGVEFSGALDDVSRGDRPFYTYGGRITVPLGNSSARYRLKSDKAIYQQQVLAMKKIEQDIMVEVDDAITQAKSSFERVGSTRKQREFSEAALAAEQKKLENGKSTSFVVLRLQRDLTSARSDEINALVQYKRAIALLAQTEGSTLDRRAIDLKAN